MSIHQDMHEALHNQDQDQYEYEFRKFYFFTQFKDRYTPINGFSAHGFYGTQKEYDEAVAPYYKSHDNGKIIGEYKLTEDEYNKRLEK